MDNIFLFLDADDNVSIPPPIGTNRKIFSTNKRHFRLRLMRVGRISGDNILRDDSFLYQLPNGLVHGLASPNFGIIADILAFFDFAADCVIGDQDIVRSHASFSVRSREEALRGNCGKGPGKDFAGRCPDILLINKAF